MVMRAWACICAYGVVSAGEDEQEKGDGRFAGAADGGPKPDLDWASPLLPPAMMPCDAV